METTVREAPMAVAGPVEEPVEWEAAEATVAVCVVEGAMATEEMAAVV